MFIGDLDTHLTANLFIFKRLESMEYMMMWLRGKDKDLLVPLIYCMVVDKNRFYLNCTQESLVLDGAVVDIESDY